MIVKIISQKRDYILNEVWKKSKIKKTQIDAIRMGKVKNHLQIDDMFKF